MLEPVEVQQTCVAGGVGYIGQLSGSLSGNTVEPDLTLFIHHGEVEIDDRPEDFDNAVLIALDQHLLPTPLAKALEPDPGSRQTAYAIPHGQGPFIGVVGIVFQQGLDLGTPLHGQPFPFFVVHILAAHKMNGRIVETPLAMADLAFHLLAVFFMCRMTQQRHRMLSAVAALERELYPHQLQIGQCWILPGLPAVTAATTWLGLVRIVAALPVAIGTDQASLLMNIRHQIMVLDTIGPLRITAGRLHGVGCAIFPVKIVLVAAVIIPAHVVAVMATQTLPVFGLLELVALHLTIFPDQMTTGAAGTVNHGRITVAA